MKTINTIKDVPSDELVAGGAPLCSGCPASLGLKLALKALGKNTIVINASGCMTLFTTYPNMPTKVPWLHVAIENAAAAATGIRAALEQLREAALGQRSTIYGSQPSAWYQEELMARRMLHEPTFSSDKPVIGPLIAAFREAWNNVSTKWYVRLILQQQVAFNTLAAGLLEDLGNQAQANASDAALLARELAAMHRRFEELAAEVRDDLDELHQQLDRIEQMLEHDGDEE